MPDDELTFDDSHLDTFSDEDRFEVTAERIAEYAAATNDRIVAHRNGDVAPPVFAIVPVFQALLVPAVDVMPVELIPRIVHGEQDFHFHRPIYPGDKLVSRAKMNGYEGLEKGTRSTILLECRTEEGELVNEQAPLAKAHAHVDLDQTFRVLESAGEGRGSAQRRGDQHRIRVGNDDSQSRSGQLRLGQGRDRGADADRGRRTRTLRRAGQRDHSDRANPSDRGHAGDGFVNERA
jgi:acyl dehydratase